jgi:hypothetical protein
MFFASWTWTWVLGSLALTSALVVLIHLLRLRRRRHEVAYLPLFEEALGDAAAAKRVDWIRRLLALLLSLAIVSSLTLSLGDPRFDVGDDGRSIVVLVDTSLSMEAGRDKRARLELAKDEARSIVRGLGRGDFAAIVAMGETPLPLSPLTDDGLSLEHAIDTITRGLGDSDIGPALHLATDILGERAGGEVVVIGDRAYESPHASSLPEGVRLTGIRVGEPLENVAIDAFATRRLPLDPARASVLLRVSNRGEVDRTARVELWSRSSIIEAHDVTLRAGATETLALEDVPVVEERLEARLVPRDDVPEGLHEDDVAHAAISPRRTVRVHVVSPGNLFLDAALLLDPTVTVTESSPDAPLPDVPPDLYVFDRALPAAPVRAPALYIAPPDSPKESLPVGLGPRLVAPHVEQIKKEDPLVAGLRFSDVNIKEARALVLSGADVSLGKFGTQAILARGAREGVPFVVMSFAVEESDLPLRITWPLFLLRTIDDLTRRDAYHRPPHRVGHAVEIDLATDAATADWYPPRGEPRAVPLSLGRARLMPVEPGVHTLEAGDARAELVVQPFGSTESDLRVPAEMTVEGARLEPPSAPRMEPLSRPMLALLALVALLLLLEHVLFHRRWIE